MSKTAVKRDLIQVLKDARDVAAKAEAEGRELTDDERALVTAKLEEGGRLKTVLVGLAGDDDLRKAINDLGDTIGLADDVAPIDHDALGAKNLKGRKTPGQRFYDDDNVKAWHERIAPNGTINEQTKGITSPPVAFRGLKDLVTGGSDTSGGSLVTPDRAPFVDVPTRPLTIRDLVTNGTTGSDTVEFVRQGLRTNNAAPVPEATSDAAIGDGTGGTVTAVAGGRKPQSGFALEKVSEAVKTIAHWIPATKRALSDAGQVRTIIDAFLITGLEEELEDQMLTGDGSGENFEGILETSGITAQAWDTDLLVTTRKAKTKVRTVGRATATAYVLNPEDNERIDLMRENTGGANTGAFLFGGPATNGVSTLWGLPRVESEGVPAGTGIVADWRLAVLWDREQAAVQASDSHADFFVRNLVAFLAELRAAFGVLRPPAFVEIDLTA